MRIHAHHLPLVKPHNRDDPNKNNTHTQTVHENRIYSLQIHCGDQYPDAPPTIQFISRVNLPFVSQTDGKVDKSKLPVLANWHRNNSIETVLVEIRRFVLLPSSRFLFVHLLSQLSLFKKSQRDGIV